jgi:hypothetical protein
MTLGDGFYAVKLVNAPGTELINCAITGGSSGPSYGVSLQGGCDLVWVKGCCISTVTSFGIHAHSGNDGLEITDNTFHKAGSNAAIYLQENRAQVTGNQVDSTQATANIWLDTRCTGSVVKDNVIIMNRPNSGFGIRLRYDNDSVLVENNTITGSSGYGSAGIYLDWKNSNVQIIGNSVDSAVVEGVVIGGSGGDNDDVWVTRNSISATDIGIHIEKRTQERVRIVNNFLHSSDYCVFNHGGETAFIAHNSIYTETGTGIFVDQRMGSTDDCTLRNNVVYSGSGYCLWVKLFFSPDGWDSDYNDLYTETGNVGRWGNTDTPTLSGWQSESDGDQHSISADPLFVSTSNLHIAEQSPCRDIGTPISWITTDIDGEARDSLLVDLGADRWSETGGGTMAGTIANIPIIFRLKQNRPNPFRQLTTIDYSIPKTGKVTLRVYDVTGRMVKQLVNKEQRAGVYTANWEGNTPNGRKLATGVYFVRLTANEKTATRKLVMVR